MSKRWTSHYNWTAFVFIAVFVGLGAVTKCAKADYGPFYAEYVRNYDGDTVHLAIKKWPDEVYTSNLRVNGIDTPEIRGDCPIEKTLAVDAKLFTEIALSNAQLIQVVIHEDSKFGDLLVDVNYDGNDLASNLLEIGLANPFDGKTKKLSWCLETKEAI